MKKRFRIFLLFLICLSFPAGSSPDLRLTGELYGSPLMPGSLYDLTGFEISTAWILGLQQIPFTHGIEIAGEYVRLNSSSRITTSSGEEFSALLGDRVNAGLFYSSHYLLSSLFELKWGTGPFWQGSYFAFDDTSFTDNNLGLRFSLAGHVFLSKYVALELINRLDMIYSIQSPGGLENVALNYTIDLRAFVRPGPDWLNIFLEVSGFYWGYSSGAVELNTMLLKLGAGVSMDEILWRQPEIVPPPEIPPVEIPIEEKFPEVKQLLEAETGEDVRFNTILFIDDSTEFTPESLPVLEAVLQVLEENEGLAVKIYAYTLFAGDPSFEFTLYKERTESIQKFFTTHGIAAERLELSKVRRTVLSLTDGDPMVSFTVLRI